MLMVNYKPAYDWKQANGSNATVNAQVDKMADSIKAQAPNKVMLLLFHEPENDVTPSTTTCALPANASQAGSAADYVAMWHAVRARFDAKGVSNVVWGMNYMLYPGGTCIVKPLWPGNDYVDWVFTDPYVTGAGARPTYLERMDFTYNWLRDNSDATHDFTSKPWGFAEWGAHEMTQAQAYQVYDDAKAALDANRYPNLKAYVIFDATSGPHGGGAVGMAEGSTTLDPVEQQHYNAFANDPHFSD
jgi:beta-mannanase